MLIYTDLFRQYTQLVGELVCSIMYRVFVGWGQVVFMLLVSPYGTS